MGEKNKVLDLAVPGKLAFLKEQLNAPEIRKKIQDTVEVHFGPGYSFQLQSGKDEVTGGTSAQAMVQQKQKVQQEELAQQVENHPMVKSAKAAFKGQIKSIKNQQTS